MLYWEWVWRPQSAVEEAEISWSRKGRSSSVNTPGKGQRRPQLCRYLLSKWDIERPLLERCRMRMCLYWAQCGTLTEKGEYGKARHWARAHLAWLAWHCQTLSTEAERASYSWPPFFLLLEFTNKLKLLEFTVRLFFPLPSIDLLVLSPLSACISCPFHFLSFSLEMISWRQPQVSHGIDFAWPAPNPSHVSSLLAWPSSGCVPPWTP